MTKKQSEIWDKSSKKARLKLAMHIMEQLEKAYDEDKYIFKISGINKIKNICLSILEEIDDYYK
jgi:hypothetical protein